MKNSLFIFLFLFMLALCPMQIDAEENCAHEYTDTVVNPTCTNEGYTVHTCINCDDSYIDSYTDATGHNYIDYDSYEECEFCHDTIEKESTNTDDIPDINQPQIGDNTNTEGDGESNTYPVEEDTVEDGWIYVDGIWKYGENNAYVNGWKAIDNVWYYFENDEMVTDYKEIDEVPFYFNTNGSLYNGWQQYDDNWYYFTNNGAKSEWLKDNNAWYYFDIYTMVTGYHEIDNTPYYFNTNGALYNGWQQYDNNWYYFTENGAKNEWYKNNGNWYYFDEYKMVTGYNNIKDIPYYFNTSGSLYSGWKSIDDSWYYFTENGAKNDWFNNNGKWYYFDDYMMVTGYQNIDNKWYKFNDTGSMFTGWDKYGEFWYYYTTTGSVDKWKKISGKWYYFDEYKMVTGYKEIKEIPYYFNTSGSLYSGWKSVENNWYYFTENGAKNKWFKKNGKWYYFDDYIMVTGYQNIDSKWYKFNNTGSMFTGWDKYNDEWYYYQSSGEMFKDGWNKISYSWYYFYDTGIMARDTYIDKYYVNENGRWSYKVLSKNALIDIINKLGKGLKYTSDYTNATLISQLKSAISAIENKGKSVSFVLIDLQTGSTISYEPQKTYYAASSIKGPYVISINKKYTNLSQSTKDTMTSTITVSSNEGYINLYNKYGATCMQEFMNYCGVNDFTYNGTAGHFYPNLTSKDLAKFWVGGYYYFNEDKNVNSDFAKSIYNRSYMSFINSANSSTVYSKPGWIAGYGLNARNDAGIVMANNGPYVLSVTSNAFGFDGELTNLAKVLNKIQTSK